ncbi:MAG TPA: hypothetical protein VHR17_06025, partial [Thermoanaerobaculia bacterium]|nr:hypothetical protein [Thermoanaerobaculia bacterium]
MIRTFFGETSGLRWATALCSALVLVALLGCSDGGKTRSHKYEGQDEAEVERSLDQFEETDRWSLKLREKQPIYFLGLP